MGLLGNRLGAIQPAPACAIHPDDQGLVRAEDRAWWNDLSLDDCNGFEHQHTVFRAAALTSFKEDEGLSEEQALKKLRLGFPFYYLTLDERAKESFPITAADAKLPYILKDRVNRAMNGRMIDGAQLSRTSSMNALVRELIRKGQM